MENLKNHEKTIRKNKENLEIPVKNWKTYLNNKTKNYEKLPKCIKIWAVRLFIYLNTPCNDEGEIP